MERLHNPLIMSTLLSDPDPAFADIANDAQARLDRVATALQE